MFVLISFFEIGTFWIRSDVIQFSTMNVFFILLTFIVTNLLNIYLGSAVWESFVPRFEGPKGYAIIGLIGTATYTFFQIYSPVRFLEDLVNYYIGCLGVVLLIAFLVRIIVKHRPRNWEQLISCFCWFIGCIVATLTKFKYLPDDMHPLLVGIGSSALIYLFILFVEETIWSAKKIFVENG